MDDILQLVVLRTITQTPKLSIQVNLTPCQRTKCGGSSNFTNKTNHRFQNLIFRVMYTETVKVQYFKLTRPVKIIRTTFISRLKIAPLSSIATSSHSSTPAKRCYVFFHKSKISQTVTEFCYFSRTLNVLYRGQDTSFCPEPDKFSLYAYLFFLHD